MPSSTDRRATRPSRAALPVAGLLAASALLSLGACNILGPVGYLASDDRTPAMYKLDPKRRTVVFVDDRNNMLGARTLRDRIAKSAEKVILENKLIEADVISSDSLYQVLAAERFSQPRSISEIGRAVQAEQVIWATIDAFSLTPDGSQHAPVATLRVKVIDAINDKRLFPPESDPAAGGGKEPSATIGIAEKVRATPLPRTTAEVLKEQQDLADVLGRKLGEVFYKHSSRDPNSPVGR